MAGIIKDSSVWFNPSEFSAAQKTDNAIRLGIVKEAVLDQRSGDIVYRVEVRYRDNKIDVNCRYARRFGGIYNYEDIVHRGYTVNQSQDTVEDYKKKAGDLVLVALIGGNQLEGVIIGSLAHTARTTTLKKEDGPQYKSEFNGVEKSINKDGELVVTIKGQPKNIAKLSETPGAALPAPEYDTKVGGAYYKFDKLGGFLLSDASTENGTQSLAIDKKNGTFVISSGKISLTLTKKTETTGLKCKILTITSEDKVTITTKEFKVEAKKSASIKAEKVAIGKDGIELLDQLIKAIDAISMVQPISPVGPCTPLKATPQWPQVEQIKAKIQQIKGSL
jgi:phage gp45-like